MLGLLLLRDGKVFSSVPWNAIHTYVMRNRSVAASMERGSKRFVSRDGKLGRKYIMARDIA